MITTIFITGKALILIGIIIDDESSEIKALFCVSAITA